MGSSLGPPAASDFSFQKPDEHKNKPYKPCSHWPKLSQVPWFVMDLSPVPHRTGGSGDWPKPQRLRDGNEWVL